MASLARRALSFEQVRSGERGGHHEPFRFFPITRLSPRVSFSIYALGWHTFVAQNEVCAMGVWIRRWWSLYADGWTAVLAKGAGSARPDEEHTVCDDAHSVCQAR